MTCIVRSARDVPSFCSRSVCSFPLSILFINAVTKEHEHQTSERERQRQEYNARELGALDGIPRGGMDERKAIITLPKLYVLGSNCSDHYADRIRVFAKCISGGRKHEMIDIMMMTQSL